ncbi:small integral membrane protein 20 [Atheta coriaria]|uniref:small integral membrane protein 20 n=1 Tax=Dalotia coriaria TaxID=877792 RepID=UPI0031F3FD5C
MSYWRGWRYTALITSIVGVIGITIYPIAIYPMQHIEEYKAIQKENRRNVIQSEIQPGNMKVWSDPFDRK